MDSPKPPAAPDPSGAVSSGRTFDLYAQITQQITDMLQKGVVPWRSPILGQTQGSYPRNLDSNRSYRGVNVFLLAFTAFTQGYDSPYWLTFNQVKARGGSVKRGEKSTLVIFWKKQEITDRESGEKKEIPLMRYFRVFNVSQCENLQLPEPDAQPPAKVAPIQAAENVVAGYADGPAIQHGGGKAFYTPSTDAVKIPKPEHFTSMEEYYSTLLHELSHNADTRIMPR